MRRSPLTYRPTLTRIGIIACLAGAAVATSLTAEGKNIRPPKKPDYRRQVEQLEDQWRVAQLNDDVAAMDRLLAEDYIGITMNGQVVTKTQQLDRMRARQFELKKIQFTDVKVKLISNTAIVTSQAEVEGTSEGTPLHGTYRYTRVYTRLPSGVWKVTNFEATRVGPPRDANAQGQAQSPSNASR